MSTHAVKQRRVTQACDFCHRRGIRCKNGSDATCQSCIEYGQECTRTRPTKKRGTKPKSQGIDVAEFEFTTPHTETSTLPSPALRNRKIVTALLDVYLDTIHPSYPLFCERELWVGWRDGSFPASSSDYMSLMCMCALSAQHVGSGALFSDEMASHEGASLSQRYLEEAVRLVPTDFDNFDMNLVRSYGFLALLGSQTGNSAMVHKYLGLYHGVSAQMNLFDESRWPLGSSPCDKEIRRRLWWALYRLEVHTACVLGSIVRCSESLCNVGYPQGLHHPAFIPGRDGNFEDWFSGWNFTTDLYRVLEHAIADFRTKRDLHSSILGNRNIQSTATIAEKLAQIQKNLLPQFSGISTRSSDSGRNRCGFQAANILCTIHLAQMISSISGENSLQAACQTARDMMASMNTIPLEYLRAIGSPLIQQLSGVGHILASVIGKQRVSPADFAQSRSVLTSIISFLAHLKQYNKTATTAEQQLSDQLANLNRQIPDTEDSYGAENSTLLDRDEMFIWTPYLEQVFPVSNHSNDVFSTNMINNFA
ncbi:hypothetical protein GQ53DRAFT_692133 [Thozetella sp. PMI_491]|nr:hypothetical protein GQ53DRAFT_692133 [Thozetella sp. PMI_491]